MDKQRVIYFDTEQSLYHVSLLDNRIARLRYEIKNTFDLFTLRPATTDERLKIIEEVVSNFDDTGLIIIDGIRDVVHDINNPEEATKISDKLLSITDKHNLHVVVVLHQNKGNEHARGHLGSELQNKAETVISVSLHDKDKELSIVKAEMTRNKSFDDFGFKINEYGLPYIDDLPIDEKPTSFAPDRNIGLPMLKKVVDKIFRNESLYTDSGFKDNLRLELSTGDSKNRAIVAYLLQEGLIINVSQSTARKQFKRGDFELVDLPTNKQFVD